MMEKRNSSFWYFRVFSIFVIVIFFLIFMFFPLSLFKGNALTDFLSEKLFSGGEQVMFDPGHCVDLDVPGTYGTHVMRIAEGSYWDYHILEDTLLCEKTYTLRDNTDYDGVITFDNPQITLDCGNSIIIQAGALDASNVGINVINLQGITVRNCNIRDFGHGIKFNNVRGSFIFDVNISAYSTSAIYFDNADYNVIKKANLSRYGSNALAEYGLRLRLHSQDNNISEITINDAAENAIFFQENSSFNNFNISRISDGNPDTSSITGAFRILDSYRNLIRDVNLTNNRRGIEVVRSGVTTCSDNTFDRIVVNGSLIGILIGAGCDRNVISNSYIHNSTDIGILIQANGVNVRNVYITNTSSNADINEGGIVINPLGAPGVNPPVLNANISDTYLFGNGAQGIFVRSAQGLIIRNVTSINSTHNIYFDTWYSDIDCGGTCFNRPVNYATVVDSFFNDSVVDDFGVESNVDVRLRAPLVGTINNITFINTNFSKTINGVVGFLITQSGGGYSQLSNKYWLNAYAYTDGASLEGINVTATNPSYSDNYAPFSRLTLGNGKIERQNLTHCTFVAGGNTCMGDYTFNAFDPLTGEPAISPLTGLPLVQSFRIINNTDLLFYFSAGGRAPLVFFGKNSPLGGSGRNSDSMYVDLNTIDSDGHYKLLNLDNSLVGWWKMDNLASAGETSTLVYDWSVNQNNCTVINLLPFTSAGRFGGAYQFSPSAIRYLDCGSSSSLNTFGLDYTMSAWIYLNNYNMDPTNGYSNYIAGRMGSAYPYSGFGLKINGLASEGFRKLALLHIGNPGLVYSDSDVSLNRWIHVAVVYHTNGSVDFYFDGALDSTKLIAQQIDAGNRPFFIGIDPRDPIRYEFDGIIDEVLVFNRSLSSGEISSLYDAHYDNTKLAGYWKMNENSGITEDSSGNGNDGTVSGASWTSDGKAGGAFDFDGINDHIKINPSSDFDMGVSQSFSIAAWIKTEVDGCTSGCIIVQRYDGQQYYRLSIADPADHKAKLAVRGDDIGFEGEPRAMGTSVVDDGEWHFITGVRDTAQDMLYIYVDGNLENSISDSSVGDLATQQPLWIGVHGSSTPSDEYFNGIIDEAMVFEYALTGKEIDYLYDSEKYRYKNNFSLLAEGEHRIIGHANDIEGNLGKTWLRRVLIDNTNPIASFVNPTPADLSVQNNRDIYVNVSVNEDNKHYSFVNFDNSLAAWYKMDNQGSVGENSQSVYDWSGSGKNGYVFGIVNHTVNGRYGGGYEFEGGVMQGRIEIPNVLPQSGSWSIAGWVYPSNNNVRKAWFGFGDGDGYFELNNNRLFNLYSSSIGLSLTSDRQYNPNQWYHVGVVYNRDNNVSLYINGVFEKADTSVSGTASHGLINYLGTDLVLGLNWNGTIDEIVAFNRSLSPGEIASLYDSSTYRNNFGYDNSLVGYWKLDNDASAGEYESWVYDWSEKGNNGNVSEAIFTSAGRFNGAFDFDGSNDYIVMGRSPSLGLNTFTLMAWFKRTGTGDIGTTGTSGVEDFVPLITKGCGEGDGDNKDANFNFGISDTNDRLAADFEDMTTGGNHPVVGITTLSNDVWYHGAVTFDGTTFTLYVNGVTDGSPVSTSAVPRYDSIAYPAIGTMIASTGSPSGCSSGNTAFFQGQIDEARIFNRALSPTEIQIMYNVMSNKYSNNFINLSAGTHKFIGYSIDVAGNMGSTGERSVNIERYPPNIQFEEPTPRYRAWTSNTYVDIHVSITDLFGIENGPGIRELIFNWDNNEYKLYDDSLVLFYNMDNRGVLGEVTNSKVVDLTRWSNNGTVSGASWTSAPSGWHGGSGTGWKSGGSGSGYDFGAAENDYISLADSTKLNFGAATDKSFTLMAWIKMDSFGESTFGRIFSKGDGTANTGYELYVRSASGGMRLAINGGGTVDSSSMTAGTWYHVAAIYNDSNNYVNYYIDGAPAGGFSSNELSPYTASSFRIGSNADNTRDFDGIIDDVKVFNRSMGATEVRQNYYSNLYEYDIHKWNLHVNRQGIVIPPGGAYSYFSSAKDFDDDFNRTETRIITFGDDILAPEVMFTEPTPEDMSVRDSIFIPINVSIAEYESGLENVTLNFSWHNFVNYNDTLVLMFNFDNVPSLGENYDVSCGVVRDLSNYGNNGFVVDSSCYAQAQSSRAVWNPSGRYGGAFEFNGNGVAGQTIRVPHSASLNPEASDFSLVFWYKPRNSPDGDLIRKGSGSAGDTQFYNFEHSPSHLTGSNRFTFEIKTSSGTDYQFVSRDSYSDNQWHFVVAQRKGKTGEIWVDGVRLDVLNYSNDALVGVMPDVTGIISNTRDLGLGSKLFLGNPDFVNGGLDELRIYMIAFNSWEIQELYRSNLYKYDPYHWSLWVEQGNLTDSRVPLGFNNFTYYVTATDIYGNVGTTEIRRIISEFSILDLHHVSNVFINPGGVNNVKFSAYVLGAFINGGSVVENVFGNFSRGSFGRGTSGPAHCTHVSNYGTADLRNYSCSVEVWYWDESGGWSANASLRTVKSESDSSLIIRSSKNKSFILWDEAHISHDSSLNFGLLDLEEVKRMEFLMNNTGNARFSDIYLTAKALTGPATLPANKFWANDVLGAGACAGTQLGSVDQIVPISKYSNYALYTGNNSLNLHNYNSGQNKFFVCFDGFAPGSLTGQYTASGVNSWELTSLPPHIGQ